MDNFVMNCKAEYIEDLRRLLKVAFSVNAPGGKTSGFKEVRLLENEDGRHVKDEDGILSFVLFWSNSSGADKFPVKMDADSVTETVWAWLENVKDQDRAESCDDLDVWEDEAFRVFTDFWGHVDGDSYAIVAVQPIWAWAGK